MRKPRKPKTAKPEEVQQIRTTPQTKSPLVFISHDNRDAELAEAFSKLLSSVSAGLLKTFRSSDRKGSAGIEYGVEWYPEIMSRLESASDVVCLLTSRSVERPWILYEAGVAKGKLNTPVYGIALGIGVNRVNTTGPFAQFQNCDDKEEALTKLVIQLLGRIPGSEPAYDAILTQVRTFKETGTKVLSELGDAEGDSETSAENSVAKLFEEIKVMFQDLPTRIEDRVSRRPRRRKMHSMMMHEMMQEMMHVGERPDDPIAVLISASVFREEVPWLYELGREAYDAIRDGDPKTARPTVERFRRGLRMVLRGPMIEELDVHPRVVMDAEHFLESYLVKSENRRLNKKKPDQSDTPDNLK